MCEQKTLNAIQLRHDASTSRQKKKKTKAQEDSRGVEAEEDGGALEHVPINDLYFYTYHHIILNSHYLSALGFKYKNEEKLRRLRWAFTDHKVGDSYVLRSNMLRSTSVKELLHIFRIPTGC